MGEQSEQNKDFNLIRFIRKNWNLILLIAIIIFGFYLRSYHINYPVIGYHNMKETHYLTEARNFARDGFLSHAGAPTIAARGMIISLFLIKFFIFEKFVTSSFANEKFL